jgi:hypothetical protein
VQRSEKINIHDPAVNAGFGIQKCASLGDSGIIDEDIDAVEMLEDLLNCCRTVIFMDHIATVTFGIKATGFEPFSRSFNPRFIPVDQRNTGTFPGEPVANSGTYSTGSTGYDDNFVFKFITHFVEYVALRALNFYLVSGCWSLASGCWFLAAVPSSVICPPSSVLCHLPSATVALKK